MQLYIELETLQLVCSPENRRIVTAIQGKRGGAIPITLQFLEAGVPVRLDASTVLTFGAKESYTSGLSVLESGFEQSDIPEDGTDDDPTWAGSLDLNTVPLDALLAGDTESTDLVGEFTWIADGDAAPTTSATFVLRVFNDVVRGDEGTPSELPAPDDDWVAHGHAQTLTNDQKAQARTNIGAGTPYSLPTASASVLGGIKVGSNLTIDENGVLSAEDGNYTLPTATDAILGGVKIGSGVTITDGVISVSTDYASSAQGQTADNVAQTISGYGDIVAYSAADFVAAGSGTADGASNPEQLLTTTAIGGLTVATLAADDLILKNGSITGTFSTAVTQARTWTMPDKDGTVAMTSDIPTTLPASDVYSWAKAATKPSYTAAEVSAARSIETKTASFTSVVGGRYIVEAGGLISITDPTTRLDSSALQAGDSYETWIGAGTVQFNATGTTFAASRFSIRRRYTGSAWATPSPMLSDTLQVGATNTWDGSTFTGAQAFSSTTRPTSSATGSPSANSLMLRSDCDGRYYKSITRNFERNLTAGNNATFYGPYNSDTQLHLTCSFLPTKIILRAIIMWTSAPGAYATSNFNFDIYHTAIGTSNMSAAAPLTVASTSVQKVVGLEQYIITAEIDASTISTKYGTYASTYGIMDIFSVELKNKTGGSLTTVGTNAGYLTIEAYR